jgi:hypothetical protein
MRKRGVGQVIINGKKRCSSCLALKELNEFHFNGGASTGRNSQCITCTTLCNRIGHLRRKFGLSLAQFNELLKKQENKCLICERTFADRPYKPNSVCPDHDHKTGRVRALICDRCNRVIGLIEENSEIALKILIYVEEICNVSYDTTEDEQ